MNLKNKFLLKIFVKKFFKKNQFNLKIYNS
jgi:hypothetical protein